MARAFNLTAELNLRGPSNVRLIVADIRRQLGTISADVDVRVNPNTSRNLNGLQTGLARLNQTLAQTQTSANNVTAAFNNLGRAIGAFNNNVNTVQRNTQHAAAACNNLNNNLGQVNRNARQGANEFEEFGRQSALAIRRFAAFATVTGVIYKFSNAISTASKEFIDFNKELVRVSQVTDTSVRDLSPLVTQITRLSSGLGVSSQDLIKVSSTLAQAGLSARDTEKALKALALSALAPSFDSLNDTVEGSIALMRQFGIGAGDLESALGSINAVAAKFAVEAGDLITAIQRTGGVFATASKGVSEGKDALNEFLAVFTSIRQTTRESAETIATGLRTIFTRIQRKDTIEALQQYGVTLTDLEGKFVGPYEAVKRLSEGLSKLDPRDLKFSSIVEELGGFRQIGKVIPLIQQFAVAQEALKTAQQGQGSLAKDAATAQQSVANQMLKVREEFNALIRSIGQSDSFQTFVKLSLDLASALIKLADSAKTVLPALTAIVAMRGASALGSFATGFSGGLRRQHFGGPVRGFASGGYVPGVGNGDTVPAMLTPGEFVIRKKAVESIGVNQLHSMNKKANGGAIRRYAQGGFSKTPLVDDLPNTKDAMKPIPGIGAGSILESIMRNGYGAVDFDRTLQRTVGDAAYGKAKTPQEKNAVLNRYFRDPSSRLQDVKTSRLTQFGTQLKDLIQQGKIDPKKITMISKSSRTPGIAEHIQQLFGIPTSNMVFTSGGSKEPALEGVRSKGPRFARAGKYNGGPIQKFANGGLAVLRAKDEMYGGLFAKPPVGKDTDPGKIVSFSGSKLPRYQGSDILAVTGRPAKYFMSSSTDDGFEAAASQALKEASEKMAASYNIAPNTSADLEQKLTQKIGVKDIAGKMFEGLLAYTSNYFGEGTDSSQGGWDFPKSMSEGQKGGLDKLFGPLARNKDYDAKLSLNDKNLKNLMEKAINSNYVNVDPFKSREEPQGVEDNRLSTLPQKKARIQSLKNIIDEAGVKLQDSPDDQNKVVSLLRGRINRIQTGIDRPKKAAFGGNISGKDTVPALLTPGEFVINKTAASSIGASRLHQLNRADRVQGYNKGGSVGRIQRFAPGGVVESTVAGMSPKDSIRLQASIAKNAQAFEQLEKMVAGWPVEDVEMALKKLDRSLEKGASTADALASSVSAGVGGGGSTRTPKKGSAPQISESIAADPRVRAMAASNQIPQTQSDTRATTNPITPRGFAASQERINQISGNAGQYQRGQDVADRRNTTVGASSSVNMSNAGLQFAASLKNATTPLQQLTQAAKNAGGGLVSLGKGALGAAGRGAGGMISGIGGSALGAIGLGRFSSAGRAAAAGGAGAAGAAGGAGMGGGRMGGMGAMVATMAGGSIINALSKSSGGETTDSGRQISHVGGNVLNYGAMGASMGSMFGPWGTAIGAASGALAGLVIGFEEAEAAGKAYAQAQLDSKAQIATEKSGKAIATYAQAKTPKARKEAFDAFSQASAAEDTAMKNKTTQKVGFLGKTANFLTGGAAGYRDQTTLELGESNVKGQEEGAKQAKELLLLEMSRTGKTLEELSKTMNPTEFGALMHNMAQADKTYTTFQTQRAQEIQNLKTTDPAAAAALEADTQNQMKIMAASINFRSKAELNAGVLAERTAKANEALIAASTKVAANLEKAFEKSSQGLDQTSIQMKAASDKIKEIVSGKLAAIPNKLTQDINTMKNPLVSSNQRKATMSKYAGRLGDTGKEALRVVDFADKAKKAAELAASNVTPSGSPENQNEALGNSIQRSLVAQINATFGPGSTMANTLITGVQTSVKKMVEGAGDTVLTTEQILDDAAGPLIRASDKAGDLLIKQAEKVAEAFDLIGAAAEEMAAVQQQQKDRQVEMNDRMRSNAMSYKEAIGGRVNSRDRLANRLARVKDSTGLQGNVNTVNLVQQLAKLDAALQAPENKPDPTRPDAQQALRISTINQQIKNTQDQLKKLPDLLQESIEDVFNEIKERVADIEAKKEAGAGFAEKLATSTPQELFELNRTYALMNNTLRGNITSIQQSADAQQAYLISLQNGKTQQEAYADAQIAFANKNKEALSLFNELSQVAGVKGAQFDVMRADLLENFAKSQGSGLQNNPMFREIIAELRRSPEERAQRDPMIQALSGTLGQLSGEQRKAVQALNLADTNNVKGMIAQTNAIVGALNGMPGQGLAKGGMVYASQGRLINFQPKGTDTVPAMLTPGEFVVNAQSTAKNIPLLKSINNSKGGMVNYLQDGGVPFKTPRLKALNDRRIQGERVKEEKQKAAMLDRLRKQLNTQLSPTDKRAALELQRRLRASNYLEGKEQRKDAVITNEEHEQIIAGLDMIDENKRFQHRQNRVNNKSDTEAEKTKRRNTPQLPPPLPHLTPQSKQYGGVVYASAGTLIPYQPQGTDTVPAMLTPGEFVVNRSATKANLPLLQSINSDHYANGGQVAGYRGPARNEKELLDFARQNTMNRLQQTAGENKLYALVQGGGIVADNGRYLSIENSGDPKKNRQTFMDLVKNTNSDDLMLQMHAEDIARNKFKLINSQQLAGKELASYKKMSPLDKIIYEFEEQRRMVPEAFGPGAFLLEGGVKYAADLEEALKTKNVKELYRAGSKRENYLEEIRQNLWGALGMVPGSGIKNPWMDDPYLQVRQMFKQQYDYATIELRNLKESWQFLQNKKIPPPLQNAGQPEYPQLQNMTTFERDNTKGFDPAEAPPAKQYFARGGVVYANNGMMIPYAPKGTDIVPAMLTPGEFVVNRQSSQKHLGLLQSINNGQYSKGGSVSYLSGGTPGSDAFQASLQSLSAIIQIGAKQLNTAFLEATKQLNGMNNRDSSNMVTQTQSSGNGVSNNIVANIDILGSRLDRFIEQLQAAIPPIIRVEGQHEVNVVINGASALQNLLQGPLSSLIHNAVQSAFNRKSRENEGN